MIGITQLRFGSAQTSPRSTVRASGPPAAIVMLGVLLSFVFTSSVAEDTAVATDWVPTAEFIAKLESQIRLPKGASPLLSYTRYYAGSILHGHRVIVGTYQHSGGGVVIEKSAHDLPIVFDGGCDYIEVTFDVSERRFIDVTCHGVA